MAISDEIEHLINNRRVVFTALHRCFSAQDADKLYLYWYKKHGNAPKVEVIGLVQELASSFGFSPAIRSKLRTTMYECLLKNDITLEKAPNEQGEKPLADISTSTNAPPVINPAKTLTDEDVVFFDLYQSLAVRIRRESATSWDEMAEIIIEDLDKHSLSDLVKSEITNWQSTTNQTTAPTLSGLDDKGNFIHMLYLAMCEELGPSIADRILAQSKSDASLSSAAQNFSPANFL